MPNYEPYKHDLTDYLLMGAIVIVAIGLACVVIGGIVEAIAALARHL